MRIYRNDISCRAEAFQILINDGWDEIGASEILDCLEENNCFVDEKKLLSISADYKDR